MVSIDTFATVGTPSAFKPHLINEPGHFQFSSASIGLDPALPFATTYLSCTLIREEVGSCGNRRLRLKARLQSSWIKGKPPPLEDVLKTIRDCAGRFEVEKIKPKDLAGAAGSPDED